MMIRDPGRAITGVPGPEAMQAAGYTDSMCGAIHLQNVNAGKYSLDPRYAALLMPIATIFKNVGEKVAGIAMPVVAPSVAKAMVGMRAIAKPSSAVLAAAVAARAASSSSITVARPKTVAKAKRKGGGKKKAADSGKGASKKGSIKSSGGKKASDKTSKKA